MFNSLPSILLHTAAERKRILLTGVLLEGEKSMKWSSKPSERRKKSKHDYETGVKRTLSSAKGINLQLQRQKETNYVCDSNSKSTKMKKESWSRRKANEHGNWTGEEKFLENFGARRKLERTAGCTDTVDQHSGTRQSQCLNVVIVPLRNVAPERVEKRSGSFLNATASFIRVFSSIQKSPNQLEWHKQNCICSRRRFMACPQTEKTTSHANLI